jgi:NAD:arginine ADP-ribosyltransferase
LRERNPTKMEKLKAFLSYLMSGLTKLPPVNATVYRGVPITTMSMTKEKYSEGMNIHWSAFNSTTTSIKKAKFFAKTGGIILRIMVKSGRSIKHFSAILSPNCRLFVVQAVHEEDGFHYVDLLEHNISAFVF